MKGPSISVRINRIKHRLSPLEFYKRELCQIGKQQSKGWKEAGICPFHHDSHAGSFYIHITTGAFKCFSCGAKGGDIIAFVMKRDSKNFVDALRELEFMGGAV